MAKFHHEAIYRGQDAMSALAAANVSICGAGALGSNLALNLARIGFTRLQVIDRDRVEEHNISTQVYSVDDVGGQKAEILRNLIFRDLGVDIGAHAKELTAANVAKLLMVAAGESPLSGRTLVVDAFDNTVSRSAIADYCRVNHLPCLHIGVNDGYGEVRWNDSYKVPSDAGIDTCDYPLARNLVMLVAAVAAEVIIRFVTSETRENYSITAGDLRINREVE